VSVSTVSTTENPALAAELASLASAPPQKDELPPEPVAPIPPDTLVQLPCGYIDSKGELHRTAEVSELNGADEEALAKASSIAVMLNTALIRGVQKVGDKPALPPLLDSMLAADRDALLVAIRRVTYGNEIEYEVTCPHCEFKHDSTVDLVRDLPSTSMDNPETDRYYRVQTSRGEAVCVLPDGKTQTEILGSLGKSPAELNTILLLGCVTQIGGMPITSVLDVRERMPARDRRALVEALTKTIYGPRLGEVTRPCPSCSQDIPLPLTLADLFRG